MYTTCSTIILLLSYKLSWHHHHHHHHHHLNNNNEDEDDDDDKNNNNSPLFLSCILFVQLSFKLCHILNTDILLFVSYFSLNSTIIKQTYRRTTDIQIVILSPIVQDDTFSNNNKTNWDRFAMMMVDDIDNDIHKYKGYGHILAIGRDHPSPFF